MSRNGAAWVLVGILVASALITIGQVGKDREPIKPNTAVVSVVVNALLIYFVWVLWKG